MSQFLLSTSPSVIWMIASLLMLLIIPGTDYVTSDAFAQYYSESIREEEEYPTVSMMSTGDSVYVGDIDISLAAPLEGSFDAPVTIVEFGDFQCPKCNQWFLNEKPILKSDYIDTGKANLYFVDFVFLGDDSVTAANASYCANEQGMYWEYHSHLYNNQGGINDGWASADNLKGFAVDIGLDTFAFDECLDSAKYNNRIDHNKQVGMSHGVEGTPTFFIIDNFDNNLTERIDGPQSHSIFAKIMDDMIIGDDLMASEVLPEAIVPEIENKKEMELKEISSIVDEQREKDDAIVSTVETQAEQTTSEVEDEAERMVYENETTVEEKLDINVNDGNKENTLGGGCLIATAAYGTELAPQVQFLREVRDNTVMSTATGAAFVTGFNQLYYSFSPTIADMERENPLFRETVRAFITPMISTLSIMTLADSGSESDVLVAGISVLALNLGIYVAAPTAVGIAVGKRIKSKVTF